MGDEEFLASVCAACCGGSNDVRSTALGEEDVNCFRRCCADDCRNIVCVFDCFLDNRSKSCIDDRDPLPESDWFRSKDAEDPLETSPFCLSMAFDPLGPNKLANIEPPGFLAVGAPHVAFLPPEVPAVSTSVKL